eukprot:TRINITY_DN12763_c0_g1_i1.p1 TRINITY_DN12763_c0_g1~~TRINITY_DN12763_c0_g1_i1.p1  ORF type:complete len:257 (+),score=46.89 TRINITY_DN12763_c0_g1_i1:833-1603(+)
MDVGDIDVAIESRGKFDDIPEVVMRLANSCRIGKVLFEPHLEGTAFTLYTKRVESYMADVEREGFSMESVKDYQVRSKALCSELVSSSGTRFKKRDFGAQLFRKKLVLEIHDPHAVWRMALAAGIKTYIVGVQIDAFVYESCGMELPTINKGVPEELLVNIRLARDEAHKLLADPTLDIPSMLSRLMRSQKVLVDMDESFVLDLMHLQQHAQATVDARLHDTLVAQLPDEKSAIRLREVRKLWIRCSTSVRRAYSS